MPGQKQANFKKFKTSPAQNIRKRNKVEDAIIDWARDDKKIAIAGHTHRPMFCSVSKQQREAGAKEESYYFNCGNGIHPRCITCIEIQDMTIELGKWHIIADPDDNMRLQVKRQPIAECKENLKDVLSKL